MRVQTPMELFVLLLSSVRENAVLHSATLEHMIGLLQDSSVRDGLQPTYVALDKTLAKVDRCFDVIRESPVAVRSDVYSVMMMEMRAALADINAPEVRRLYVLSKIHQLNYLRIGELLAVIAAADATEHRGLGVLLESCLVEKLAFMDATARLITDTPVT